MIRSWSCFFVFCFFIHILIFSFFPRKHASDRLQNAIIHEVLNSQAPPSATEWAGTDLWQILLWEVMELSEDFSGIEQPNFHMRPHRVMRYSFSVVARVLKLVYLNQWLIPEPKPSREYLNFNLLLPRYYSFLFRLTPF